jgi:hypothetical protein
MPFFAGSHPHRPLSNNLYYKEELKCTSENQIWMVATWTLAGRHWTAYCGGDIESALLSAPRSDCGKQAVGDDCFPCDHHCRRPSGARVFLRAATAEASLVIAMIARQLSDRGGFRWPIG